ncbi:MAG: formylglycine-generating enzyme family protein, partial [Bacteroidota bacterium]
VILIYPEHQKELEGYRATVQYAIQEKSIDFQKWKLQEEKELQLTIINLRHQLNWEIAKYNRQTALNTIREQRRLVNSPINLVSDDLLESPYSNSSMPLRILLSPPELNSDSLGQQSLGFKIENHLAEELREFLQQSYSFNGKQRQTQLLDGAWVSKKFRGGAGIQALHSQLKAVPTIVLESEADNNYLNFRVAYWRGDGSEPVHNSILSGFSYRNFLYESARDRARNWAKIKEQLQAKGKSEEQIKAMGGSNEFNLFILQQEQELSQDGIDLEDLEIQKQYKIGEKDFQRLHKYLITTHCIAASVIADIHYLTQNDTLTPLLPSLLPELLKELPNNHELQKTMLDWLVDSYNLVYQKLEKLMAGWIPELMMQFAVALSNLEDKSYAKKQGEESVKAWLRVRGIKNYSRKALKDVVTRNDEPYFKSLQKFIRKMESEEGLALIKQLLEDWQLLNDFDVVSDSPEANVDDVDTKETPKSNNLGEEFSFEVVEVDKSGNIIKRETKTNLQQIFDLGNGVELEMVYIPEGTLMMNIPSDKSQEEVELARVPYRKKVDSSGIAIHQAPEWNVEISVKKELFVENLENEVTSQHKITLKPFWIAKYPITQAQYQAITGNEPSVFKGNSNPVERISHVDTVKFCYELSKKLGIEFNLPSEAQWEYACRAGTTTPFYFGNILNFNLANYDARDFYNIEPSKQTTSVGSFPPNAFGLYDMHGNVWEWCADTWHENKDSIPTNGSAFVSESSGENILRGGSWKEISKNCRSTCRGRGTCDSRSNEFGFRVVSNLI